MTLAHLLAGRRIMVLEDDLMQALDLSASLSDAGALVLGPVATLDEAAQLVSAGNCDAAILDLRLRDRNATALARRLLTERIPFIVYTGYPDSAFFRSDWPGHELVTKPANIDELIGKIAALIAWRDGKPADERPAD
jgi:DNA-binding response OmpR family regulator